MPPEPDPAPTASPHPSTSSIRSSRRAAAVAGGLAVVLVALLAVGAGSTAAGATTRWQAPGAIGGTTEPRGEPADDSLPVPEPSAEDADQRADEILADPKFDEPEPGLLDRILRWIIEQLDKIRIPGLGGAGAGGSQILGWIFIALLAGLAIFLVSRTRLSRRPRQDDPDFIVDTEVSRSQHEWLSEAERFEAEGQWKQALRCRFRALVSALVDRGVVRDIPGRTTGEYRVEVTRNAPVASASFAGAAELFDRAWYGDQPTGADENVRFRGLADDLVRQLDAAAAADAVPVKAGVGASGAGGEGS